MFICEIWLFDWYFLNSANLICQTRIFRSVSEGLFNLEITRVDCINQVWMPAQELLWNPRLVLSKFLSKLKLPSGSWGTNHTRLDRCSIKNKQCAKVFKTTS